MASRKAFQKRRKAPVMLSPADIDFSNLRLGSAEAGEIFPADTGRSRDYPSQYA